MWFDVLTDSGVPNFDTPIMPRSPKEYSNVLIGKHWYGMSLRYSKCFSHDKNPQAMRLAWRYAPCAPGIGCRWLVSLTPLNCPVSGKVLSVDTDSPTCCLLTSLEGHCTENMMQLSSRFALNDKCYSYKWIWLHMLSRRTLFTPVTAKGLFQSVHGQRCIILLLW